MIFTPKNYYRLAFGWPVPFIARAAEGFSGAGCKVLRTRDAGKQAERKGSTKNENEVTPKWKNYFVR